MATATPAAPVKAAPKLPNIKRQQLADIRAGLGLEPNDELPDCLEDEFLKIQAVQKRLGFNSFLSADLLTFLCVKVLEIESRKKPKPSKPEAV